MLNGSAIRALVVGGGAVAARKVRGLLDAGAAVRVAATAYAPDVLALESHPRVTVLQARPYAADLLDGATLVIAATDDRAVNARIATDATARGCLVNVVDDPAAGTCITPAVHRADGLVIAVSANGVPGAARRVREAIARRFDGRYGAALERLAALRATLLGSGREDGRARWSSAQQTLIGEDFCDAVEQGEFESRVVAWG
jgi:siroheme synthase-like protein